MENVDFVDFLMRWVANESRFPNMGSLAQQIIGISGSQIETERIFSIIGVFTNLRRCHLGVENLDKLIMIYKNWLLDA